MDSAPASRNDGKRLTCACGVYTSEPRFMLLHLQESPDCEWSEAQRGLVRARMIELEEYITAERMHLRLRENELEVLHKIFKHAPTPVKRERRCRICHRPTTETINGSPECSKHHRKMDDTVLRNPKTGKLVPSVKSVIEEFLSDS